ncbi:MAG TPA: diguanylate cyclase [Dehalococcoidia bacterium]|nr:diguanylate cyclase [Dehalococcoidia bacterium]
MERVQSGVIDRVRAEQYEQALARIVLISLFMAFWGLLWALRMPLPVEFLILMALENAFFLGYLGLVARLPSARSIVAASYGMLAVEIVVHTTMVYFLGTLSWLGSFAYMYGLIFANTFLDLKRGLVFTTCDAGAFVALILLEATGVVPHHPVFPENPLRYRDPRFVATTILLSAGVFYTVYLWVNWVGHQLRRERDAALRAQAEAARASEALREANLQLEARVRERTRELEESNRRLADLTERLRELADRDPLTGIWNRRAGRERMAQRFGEASERALPFAVLLFDVDGFKALNDRHGHDTGDVVLQRLAHALSAAATGADVVSRRGGDEFEVALFGRGASGAIEYAATVAGALDGAGDGVPHFTVSVGVAAFPADATTFDALCVRADKAMYRAKQAGGGHIAAWSADAAEAA